MKLIVTLFITFSLLAQSDQYEDKLKKCDLANAMCQVVIKTQDKQITDLKAQVKGLEDKLASDDAPSLIRPWMWVAIGFIAGGAVVYKLK